MKKYIFFTAFLVILTVCIYYVTMTVGIYVNPKENDEMTATFLVEGKKLYQWKSGVKEEFIIKGVDIDSGIPGYHTTDFKISKETYLRWFDLIQDMGANTIRVYTILNDTFYNAFYEYNTTHDQPLYLLQGLWVTDYANDSSQDAYAPQFKDQLFKDVRDAVDIIHGRKNISTNQVRGSGTYHRDISEWVIGFMAGISWNARTIAYTDQMQDENAVFQGEYFRTSEKADAFEALLAETMDLCVSYEGKKYGEQRLISFANDPSIDPFIYDYDAASQIEKFVTLDAEHIIPQSQLKSGYFASYHLFEFCPDFTEYLEESEKERLKDILPLIDKNSVQDGYVDLLSRYHTMPVVITGYGYSTARGPDKRAPITEEEQGQALINTYEDIRKAGCSGAFISTWQDVWARRSSTTMHKVDTHNAFEWSDYQTPDQFYGLLSFDPGKEESVCYVDGDDSEWNGNDIVVEDGSMTLSVKQDVKFLYLYLQDESFDPTREYTIGFDITPKSGSNYCALNGSKFKRNVDFVLYSKGREDTGLFVQERYNVLREHNLYDIEGRDPFVRPPDQDSPAFQKIEQILPKLEVVEDLYDSEENSISRVELYETGKLRYGNTNPKNASYNSLGDFCDTKEGREIRIPWQLLNFYLPSRGRIHDDYYKHYGVEDMKIDSIYLGVGSEDNNNNRIEMGQVKLINWGNRPAYHERLKQSYYIVKKSWS